MKKKFQKVRLVCTSDNEYGRDADDDLLNQRCLDRFTGEGKRLRTINGGEGKRRSRSKNSKMNDEQRFVVPLITKFKASQARITPQQRFLPKLSTIPCSLYEGKVSHTPMIGMEIRTPDMLLGVSGDETGGPSIFNSDQRPITPSIDQQISAEIRELTQ